METVLKQVPTLSAAIIIICALYIVFREYRKLRQENEKSIKQAVEAKLGSIVSNIQTETLRIDQSIKDIDSKIRSIEEKYRSFVANVEKSTESISGIVTNAEEKLGTLVKSIPDVEDYSAEEIYHLARQQETSQQKASLCKKILMHKDASSIDLELAGDLMRNMGRTILAMSLYEEAHKKDPEKTSPHIELLSLRAKIVPETRDESLELAKKITLENPALTQFSRIADVLINLRRHQELYDFSLEFLNRAGSMSKAHKVLALRNMAVACSSLGNITNSIELFKEAFTVCPNDENTLKPYLQILDEQGNSKEYITTARKLIDIDPNDVQYYFFLINGLFNNNMHSDAEPWIKAASQLPLDISDQFQLKSIVQKYSAWKNKELITPV